MKTVLLFLAAFVILSPSLASAQTHEDLEAAAVVVGPKGITHAQAKLLVVAYFFRCINLCGGPDEPVSHRRYWSAEVFVGYLPTSRGFIRVEKATGAVSFPGKPTLLPQDFASPPPMFRSPSTPNPALQ